MSAGGTGWFQGRACSHLTGVWDAVLDLIFPRNCLGCGNLCGGRSDWDYLCASCIRQADWIRAPYCHTCGHPFPGIGSGQSCSHCQAIDPFFSGGRCFFLHRGIGAKWIKAFKYQDGRFLAGDLRRMITEVDGIDEFVRGAVLVPVPLHPVRLRERGYNQSEWICRRWARILPMAGVECLLDRPRWTGSQTRLAREERARNVRNAFCLAEGANVRADLTYVIVDDVFTTGSTLNECCRELYRAGARRMKVLALAHG